MKEILIKEIKELLKVKKDENIDINSNYLKYFEIEELEEIKLELNKRKENINNITSSYLDELYEKTKKDEL